MSITPLQFAIIPAGGKGRRLLPVTSYLPKELIPVGNKPMIHYVMERIVDAGISNVVIVLNPEKDSLLRYIRQEFSGKINLNFVPQREPAGVADAIVLCEPLIGKNPFLLWMPDSFCSGDEDFVKRLLGLFSKTGKTTLGIYLINREKAYLYGNCGLIKGNLTPDGYLEIFSLSDKRPGSFEIVDGISAYRVMGVSVCTGEFFEFIKKYQAIHEEGELDDVPVFQMILRERGMVGEIFRGDYFDVGNQDGLMHAQHFLWEKTHPKKSCDFLGTPFEMIVLGSGVAVPHKSRFAPGYALKVNNRYLLFDPSAGTIHRAIKYGISLSEISHIFFTHLHPDHTGDLVPILFALKNPDIGQVSLEILGPPGFKEFFTALKKVYGRWIDVSLDRARISEIPSGGINNKEWGIQWEPVIHSEGSIGYRVTHHESGKVLAYSGDADYCDGIIKLVSDADVAVLECSFPEQFKEAGHLTPALCGRIAREGRVRHLVLSHFYPRCDGEDIIAQCRREYSGIITLATDYLRLPI